MARLISPVIPGGSEDGAVSTASSAQHGKPLKRFDVVSFVPHRAEVTVLMRCQTRCEIFMLNNGQLDTDVRSGIIIAATQRLTAGFASLAMARTARGDCR